MVVHFCRDVTRALAYLHSDENKIVHRDVKAANILLTEGGHAKLVDFGISTNFTGLVPASSPTPHPRVLAPTSVSLPNTLMVHIICAVSVTKCRSSVVSGQVVWFCFLLMIP